MTRPTPTPALGASALQPLPRVVRLKSSSFRPRKAEFEEPIRVDTAPEEVARAVVGPVRIVEGRDLMRRLAAVAVAVGVLWGLPATAQECGG